MIESDRTQRYVRAARELLDLAETWDSMDRDKEDAVLAGIVDRMQPRVLVAARGPDNGG